MLFINKFNWAFSLKLAFLYTLSKLKFTHPFLPENLNDKLPTGWNSEMFWTAFKSGGKKVHFDYYCRLKEPRSYQPKVSVDPKFKLSEQDIKFFYDNGYVGPFDLMSVEEAEELRKYLIDSVVGTQSQIFSLTKDCQFEEQSNISDGLLPEGTPTVTKNYKKFFLKRFNTLNRHLDNTKLLDLFREPAIIERCAQLVGADLMLWRSRFFEIPSHSKGTQWHQNSNWLYENMKESVVEPKDCEEIFQVTCWIALTEADKNKGAMVILPGTNKEMYPLKIGEQQTEDTKSSHLYSFGNGEIDYPVDSAEKKLLEMKAGQFFIFSERVIHGSLDNTTDSSRWAVNCRIAKTDTRIYTKEMLEKGHKDTYHNIKNISLDNWKAVLVRGEDRFGYNRMTK